MINIYAHNIGAPKYTKQLLADLKGEVDSNTIIVGNCNTPLLMDRSYRKKVNKETAALKETLDQMDLINLYRTFYPNAVQYTYFLSAHETFLRIDHMLEHKTSLSEFKKIEIISTIFPDHNGMKLEINHKKKAGKLQICGD